MASVTRLRLPALGLVVLAVLGLLVLAALAPARAAAAQEAVHVIPEFVFESGARLPNMKVGYVTHGTLSPAKDNAILVTHGTSGNRNSYNLFIGPGKAFDTDRYFVITVDAIGGGLSSSPKDGLGLGFPRYTIRDMVRAQHDLVTRGLGLPGLLAVGGASMGSFQAIEWGIHYPGFARGLLLIVPAASSDQLFASIVDAMVATVQLDPAWSEGRYTQNPAEGLRRAGMIFFPWLWSDEWLANLKTEEEYEKAKMAFGNGWASGWDATSWMYRYLASRGHNVGKPFGGSVEQALARVQARALIMPSVTDRLIPPAYARELYRGIRQATYVEIPSIAGHLGCCPGSDKSAEYAFISARLKEFLEGLPR
jgi:homoserine O-acetyltransferase